MAIVMTICSLVVVVRPARVLDAPWLAALSYQIILHHSSTIDIVPVISVALFGLATTLAARALALGAPPKFAFRGGALPPRKLCGKMIDTDPSPGTSRLQMSKQWVVRLQADEWEVHEWEDWMPNWWIKYDNWILARAAELRLNEKHVRGEDYYKELRQRRGFRG